jgi:hypothetical protein
MRLNSLGKSAEWLSTLSLDLSSLLPFSCNLAVINLTVFSQLVPLYKRPKQTRDVLPMTGIVQLQELLFGLQNPTNEKLFIHRCAKLFDPDDSRTWIDVYQPRIAAPIPTEASPTNNAPGDGPLRNGETAHRVGDDIE